MKRITKVVKFCVEQALECESSSISRVNGYKILLTKQIKRICSHEYLNMNADNLHKKSECKICIVSPLALYIRV